MWHEIETTIIENMSYIAERFESEPEYNWLDTKFDMLTGYDFAETDIFKGRGTIYAWIQGRGLEALVGHVQWLRSLRRSEADELAKRLLKIISMLHKNLVHSWEHNKHHMFFFLKDDGSACEIDAERNLRNPKFIDSAEPYNFSDLFCAKGLYAAGQLLNENVRLAGIESYCQNIIESAISGRFVSDQYPFQPENQVQSVTGRISHAPKMINIGLASLMIWYEVPGAIEAGLSLIESILREHVNLHDRWPGLQEYDFIEYIDLRKMPYRQEGHIISDPGHAIEFVGLSLKLLERVGQNEMSSSEQRQRCKCLEQILPLIFQVSFKNGLNPEIGGICKLLSLSERRVLVAEMPWWSLPEAIRAASYCLKLTQDAHYEEIISYCWKNFRMRYIRPERHWFQFQVLGTDGEPVTAIPATPDLDPGYHTGICLIDALVSLSSRQDCVCGKAVGR